MIGFNWMGRFFRTTPETHFISLVIETVLHNIAFMSNAILEDYYIFL